MANLLTKGGAPTLEFFKSFYPRENKECVRLLGVSELPSLALVICFVACLIFMSSFLMFSYHLACRSKCGFTIQMYHIIKFRNQPNKKSLPLHAKVLRGHLGM